MECVTWWKPDLGPPRRGSRRLYRTQETEEVPNKPDIPQPPDWELPDVANDSGLPPFTGEDLEQPRRPKPQKRPKDQPSI